MFNLCLHDRIILYPICRKKADIAPLLDVEDMVRMKKPDWKCVFTYVQSFYRKLRDHENNKHTYMQQWDVVSGSGSENKRSCSIIHYREKTLHYIKISWNQLTFLSYHFSLLLLVDGKINKSLSIEIYLLLLRHVLILVLHFTWLCAMPLGM